VGVATDDVARPWGVTEQVLWLDLVGYLPDDILTKLDRAAMAVSLETRVPFLDRQVLDVAWRLPLSSKLQGRATKRVLRTILHRHVPSALVDRPKMGFGVPVGAWLRGPLRPWAEDLVSVVVSSTTAFSTLTLFGAPGRRTRAGGATSVTLCGMCSCSSPGWTGG